MSIYSGEGLVSHELAVLPTSSSINSAQSSTHQADLRSLHSAYSRTSIHSQRSILSTRNVRHDPATPASKPRSSSDLENGTLVQDYERSDDALEQPAFEVVIPLEKNVIGQLNMQLLLEHVKKPIPTTEPTPAEPAPTDAAMHLKKPNTLMVFYVHHHPTVFAEDFTDLKDTPFLQTIGSSVFWLDVWGYDLPFLSTLAKILGIHPLSVEDIWDEEHREKCELFEEYTFICLKALLGRNEETGSLLDWGGLYIITTEKYVITFHMDNLPQLSNVYKRLDDLKNLSLTPGWILYGIMDHVVDRFLPLVDMTHLESDTIDELALLVTQQSQNEILGRISQARKSVTSLQKLISHKSGIFTMIQSREQKFQKVSFQKEELLYIEDIHSHVVGMSQSLLQQEEILNRAHGAYLAQISVELTQSSNRMGLTMKKFTAGACIFLPLTLISGVMGVNMQVPFNVGYGLDHPGWFWGLVLFMVLLAIVLVLIGRRYRWFSMK